MVSLRASSSNASSLRSASPDTLAHSIANVPTSPHSKTSNGSGSGRCSQVSSASDNEENITITANRTLGKKKGKRKSQEDLRFLAVSTHITELSYSISDIQTRIFEIQELRHKSQSSDAAAGATSTIDQSLMNLDERLEAVTQGVKSVSDALSPLMSQNKEEGHTGEEGVILRKHAALMTEWGAVQTESETLRDELKEDKWLIVFRTVTEQAGGLMTSLEKGVNRCQDFITQVYQRRSEDSTLEAPFRSEKSPPTLESYMTLLQSYEAKKKHYVPAITKVLSVLDKGAQDRVTKNGECLRRHAESTQRWKNLRDRIHRTDDEMERARRTLQNEDFTSSEGGSNASGKISMSRNGYLGVSPNGNGSGSKSKTPSTLSRSMSPFRKLARKIKGSPKTPTIPVTPVVPKRVPSREPSSDALPTLRHRSSAFRRGQTPVTPERPGHKYSQSLSPDAIFLMQPTKMDPEPLVKGRPKWNSSTKVEGEERTGTVRQLRPPTGDIISPSISATMSASTSGGSPYSRSLSRTSMTSSRPWSPVTSSVASTTQSSLFNRPPSRIRPPSRVSRTARPPSRSQMQTPGPAKVSPPRARPKTPSHIPAPSTQWRALFDDGDSASSYVQRVFSPTFSSSAASTFSVSGRETPSNSLSPVPRPPSRSMIPIPTLKFSSASRPSSTMSNYSESPEASYRRAQTPESALRQRVMQLPVYQDSRATPRPSFKLPPSSFRDGTPRTPSSRPASRTAPNPPTDQNAHIYVPASAKDPLDAEVAHIVNSIPHGLLIERVDPPLKTAPKEGEEVRAQYAISNALARKVITCRLTTLTRPSAKGSGQDPTTTKKVMCRVGGGWQDLQIYILNRQAGM